MLFKKKSEKEKQDALFYKGIKKAYKKEKDLGPILNSAYDAVVRFRDEFGVIMRCEEFGKVGSDGDTAVYSDAFIKAFEAKRNKALSLYRGLFASYDYYMTLLKLYIERVGNRIASQTRRDEAEAANCLVGTANALIENLDELFEKALSRMEIDQSITQSVELFLLKFNNVYDRGGLSVEEAYKETCNELKRDKNFKPFDGNFFARKKSTVNEATGNPEDKLEFGIVLKREVDAQEDQNEMGK